MAKPLSDQGNPTLGVSPGLGGEGGRGGYSSPRGFKDAAKNCWSEGTSTGILATLISNSVTLGEILPCILVLQPQTVP